MVAAGDGAYLLYSAERGRNWDIFALPVTAAGPGKPVAVTDDAPADVKPGGGVARRRAVGGVGIEPRAARAASGWPPLRNGRAGPRGSR